MITKEQALEAVKNLFNGWWAKGDDDPYCVLRKFLDQHIDPAPDHSEDKLNMVERAITHCSTKYLAEIQADAARYQWLKRQNELTCKNTAEASVIFNIGHDWIEQADLNLVIDSRRAG